MEKCKMCGDCCEYRTTVVSIKSNYKKYLQAHYGNEYNKTFPKDEIGFITEHRCKQLTEDNLCRIHDNKPEICKRYFCLKDGVVG